MSWLLLPLFKKQLLIFNNSIQLNLILVRLIPDQRVFLQYIQRQHHFYYLIERLAIVADSLFFESKLNFF